MCAVCSVVSSSLRLCPWNFPGRNTGAVCHLFLQGILPGPESKPMSPVSPALQVNSLPTELLGKSLGLQWDQTSQSQRKSVLNIHWKDWCWSWNSKSLATWCEELTHVKRPWSGKDWRQEEKGYNRGWDGWMASPTQWTWVWINPGSWWWTGKVGVLQSMGLQRVGHDWAELNWTEHTCSSSI